MTGTALIASRLNDDYRQFVALGEDWVAAGLRVGEQLHAHKDSLVHGEWRDWLASNFEGSERTAQRLMKAHADAEANPTRVADFTSMRQISQAFSEPKEPTHRESTKEVANLLQRVSQPDAGEIVDAEIVDDIDPRVERVMAALLKTHEDLRGTLSLNAESGKSERARIVRDLRNLLDRFVITPV